MDTQIRTTRKTIDFTDEQVIRMDRAREDRKVTYNELVGSAVDAYLSPQASIHAGEPLADQTAIEHIQQRLWNLDSHSQKTAERLAAIETHLEGLQGIVDKAMDLLILIGEHLADAPVNAPPPKVRRMVTPTPRVEPEEPPVTDLLNDPRSQWYVPPVKPPEKRSWFRGSKA